MVFPSKTCNFFPHGWEANFFFSQAHETNFFFPNNPGTNYFFFRRGGGRGDWSREEWGEMGNIEGMLKNNNSKHSQL
jgi:hypothetical protein